MVIPSEHGFITKTPRGWRTNEYMVKKINLINKDNFERKLNYKCRSWWQPQFFYQENANYSDFSANNDENEELGKGFYLTVKLP